MQIPVQKKMDGEADWWEVVEPYTFTDLTGKSFTIPRGFVTDFASVPRILWPIVPPHGKTAEAAIIHDYLYESNSGHRLNADLLFFVIAGQLVKEWQATTMYLIIRALGAKRWKKYAQKKQQNELQKIPFEKEK